MEATPSSLPWFTDLESCSLVTETPLPVPWIPNPNLDPNPEPYAVSLRPPPP